MTTMASNNLFQYHIIWNPIFWSQAFQIKKFCNLTAKLCSLPLRYESEHSSLSQTHLFWLSVCSSCSKFFAYTRMTRTERCDKTQHTLLTLSSLLCTSLWPILSVQNKSLQVYSSQLEITMPSISLNSLHTKKSVT